MPRAPRFAVPESPGPQVGAGDYAPAPSRPEIDPGFEVLGGPFDHEGLNLYRESGDVAALADASFNDWSWVIYKLRSAEEMARERTRHQRVLVTRMSGPLDINRMQEVCGGGVFEIRGFFGNVLRTRLIQELAGPVKDYSVAPPVSNAANAAPAAAAGASFFPRPRSRTERMMLRMMRQQGRTLEKLTERITSPPAPVQAQAGIDVQTVLSLADKLAQRQNPAPEAATLNHVVDAFKQGMSISREINGAPERTQTEIIVEKAMPAIERLLGALLTRRPGPAPRAAAPGRPGTAPAPGRPVPHEDVTEAAVVEPAEPDMDTVRMMSAVDALARAIADGRDADEFAASLEDILSPEQVSVLQLTPEAQVIESVTQGSGGKYPVLATAGGKAYLAAVLTALRSDDAGDELEDGPAV